MTEANPERDESSLPPTPLQATPPVADTGSNSARPRDSIELAWQRSWRNLHFRFPRLVPTPYREERDYLLRQDAEQNIKLRVPPEEHVRVVAVWGVEIFGPAEADRLHSAITRLGWNDDQLFGFNTDLGSWIGEQRTYGSEGSFNLGVIERPGESRFLTRGRKAPLPDAVDYVRGWVYQLSPSLTAVSLCFVLTDAASSAYQTEINHDRKTVHEPLKGGYRSYDVKHAKRRAVELARTQTRALVSEWFTAYLPGLFSLATDGNRLPTSELLTTDTQSLFAIERVSIEPDWVQLVTPRGHHEVWALNSFDGLNLCWPNIEGDLRYHCVVNLRSGLLTEDHLKYRGDPSNAVHASFVDDHFRGVLVNFGAIAALREITRRLRLTPNTLSSDTTSRRGTVKCLEQIRKFFDRSVGVPAFTSELAAKSEQVHSYRWNCEEFQTIPWHPEEKPALISETLRSRTQFFAARAQSLERETREQLEQLSAILSTRENIRTQARMELVTVGAAIVSIASLVVAVMSVDRFANYVNLKVEAVYKAK